MTKFILACATSFSLHWFLLSQWPSPMVRVAQWASPEPMDVVYVPPPARAPSVPHLPDPRPLALESRPAPPRSILRQPERVAARPAPPPAPAPWPSPAPLAPRSFDPRTLSPDPRSPAPILLTPADFAQFRYKQMVRERLRRAIRYPVAAGWARGHVRLQIAVARDGQVASAACLGSDAPLFEEATMAGVSALTDLPGFPQDLPASSLGWEFLVVFTPGDPPTVSP